MGASACAPCPAGTKGSAPGAVLCAPCLGAGQTSLGGSVRCDKCQMDYYDDCGSDCGLPLIDVDCKFCADEDGVDASKCAVGTTVLTLPIKEGWWRKDLVDDDGNLELYRCEVRPLCGGGAGLAGDALCARGAKGVLCNACRNGYYLDRLRRTCASCASSRGALTWVLVFLAAGLAAFAAGRRLYMKTQNAPELRASVEWWFHAAVLFWYLGQTFAIFMRVEAIRLVPPLSWLLWVADVLTGSFLTELGAPCVTFLTSRRGRAGVTTSSSSREDDAGAKMPRWSRRTIETKSSNDHPTPKNVRGSFLFERTGRYYERFVVVALAPVGWALALLVAWRVHDACRSGLDDDARKRLRAIYATALVFGVVLFHTTLTVQVVEFFNCETVGDDHVLAAGAGFQKNVSRVCWVLGPWFFKNDAVRADAAKIISQNGLRVSRRNSRVCARRCSARTTGSRVDPPRTDG